jgi:hypothetical protein
MSLSPPTNPQHAVAVTEKSLPVSGLRVVLTQRGPRQTLQIEDFDGRLMGVISDSLLDPTVLRGGWHGVRNGQPWSFAVGRSVSRPVSITFSSRRLRRPGAKPQAVVFEPGWIGDFWLAEAATDATRAAVTVAGVQAGTRVLERLA